MSKPERILLRVGKGVLMPADDLARGRLRAKGYSVGDVVSAELRKPRNPRYHRLAHALGQLLADNLEAFEGLDCHAVLKRLQWESGIGCEEMGVQVPGGGFAMVRWPKSLSFASMEQGEFEQVYRGLCRHVAARYWPGMDEHQIAEMVEMMPSEVA